MAAVGATPKDPAIHYNLGVLLLREGNIPGAIGCLPAHAAARSALGRGAQQPRGGPRRQGRRGRGAQGVPRRDQGGPPLCRGVVQPRPLLLPHRRQPAGQRLLRPGAEDHPHRQRALHPARAALPPSGQARPGGDRLPEGHRPDGRGPEGRPQHRGLPRAGDGLRRPGPLQGSGGGAGAGGEGIPRRQLRPGRRWPMPIWRWATSTAPSPRPSSGCSSNRPPRPGWTWPRSTRGSGWPSKAEPLYQAVPPGCAGQLRRRAGAGRPLPRPGRLRRRGQGADPGQGPPPRRHRRPLPAGHPPLPARPPRSRIARAGAGGAP